VRVPPVLLKVIILVSSSSLSMLKRWNKANVRGESNKGGVYAFYDEEKRRIYAGRASGNVGEPWGPNPNGGRYRYGLRHRLQSYHQKDDAAEHPTKVALRREIAYYYTREIANKQNRRATEKRWKEGNRHNHKKADGHGH